MGVLKGHLTGVLATSKAHNITTHEAVLEQRVELFSDYLTAVGFQAEPVLLMHENNQAAAEIGQRINRRKGDFQFHLGTEQHQLWILSPEEVTRLNNLCEDCRAISSGRWTSSFCKYFKHSKRKSK